MNNLTMAAVCMKYISKSMLLKILMKFVCFYLVYTYILGILSYIINYIFLNSKCSLIGYLLFFNFRCFLLVPLLMLYNFAINLFPPKLLTRILIALTLSGCISLPVSSFQYGLDLNIARVLINIIVFSITGSGVEVLKSLYNFLILHKCYNLRFLKIIE
jgi:hypothetical protein